MDCIEDNEELYRSNPDPDGRVIPPIKHYEINHNILRVKRTAFNDRNYQPSVDRKRLITSLSSIKFNNETDVIFKILAEDVRKIRDTENKRSHDVKFDPTEDRPAHTLITTTPSFEKKEKNEWKKFQELLALSASKYGLISE